MKQINEIKTKLEALRNLDKACAIFGAHKHKYHLNATLSEEEIAQIETENGIVISEEYREVLKYLGNGYAGPGYGLEELSLAHINPPYMGTNELLRNWEDPGKMEEDMVDLDEISGYIKLIDYGCCMETCLIVNGKEQGDLIFFDCDGRFEKIKDKSLLDIYEKWLDESIGVMERVRKKLLEMPLQEVIGSEWELKNYFVKDIILSLVEAEPLRDGHTGKELNEHLEKAYQRWKTQTTN
jgi:hypothetical protein